MMVTEAGANYRSLIHKLVPVTYRRLLIRKLGSDPGRVVERVVAG